VLASLKEVNLLRDTLFFLPSLDHDKEFPYAGSSIASALSVNGIGETLTGPALPPANSGPFNGSRFTDLDEWQGIYSGLFDNTGNLIDEPTNSIDNSFTSLEILDSHSVTSVQQSTQFAWPIVASSLSSDSTNNTALPEPAREVAIRKATRTRRRSSKPILKGPNPNGRKGKPRCDYCRNGRHGVISQKESVIISSVCTKAWSSLALPVKSVASSVLTKSMAPNKSRTFLELLFQSPRPRRSPFTRRRGLQTTKD